MKELLILLSVGSCLIFSACVQQKSPYLGTTPSDPSFEEDIDSINNHIDSIVGMTLTGPRERKPSCDELLEAHRSGWLSNNSAERRLRYVNSVHGSIDNEWLTKERERKFYNMKLRYNWMVENVLGKCNHRYSVDRINRERINKYSSLPQRI